MQLEQSTVGKVLSSFAILPPMWLSRSTRSTSRPASAQSRAAWMPATPPPMTSTRLVDSKDLENSGLSRRSFSTAMRTSSAALLVLASLSLPIHDTCSRILAISNMYLLSPARSTVRRKVGSCIRGVQEATTTPSSLCSLMAATISSCPGSEQVYMVSVEKATSG